MCLSPQHQAANFPQRSRAARPGLGQISQNGALLIGIKRTSCGDRKIPSKVAHERIPVFACHETPRLTFIMAS